MFSTLGFHHRGATPLMFSILCGAVDASRALLKAGARRDLRNSRGKTAYDLASEFGAPPSLTAALDLKSLCLTPPLLEQLTEEEDLFSI